MKARDIKELGVEELDQKVREMSQELNDMRLKHCSNAGLDKPVRLRTMRRDVARMKTVQGARRAK